LRYARELFETIRGRGVFEIERLRQAAMPSVYGAPRSEKRAHGVAFSGFEQAMWDLQGKALGLPCYELFGGKLRDEIRIYANINRSLRGDDRTPANFAAMARRAVDAGIGAVKMASFDLLRRDDPDAARFARDTQFGIDCIQAVRDEVGPDVDVLVDAHSRFDREQALALLPRLEPLNLFWLEEVCRPTDDLAAVNQVAPMPTAGGESLFGVDEFLPYIAADAVDIVMPDVKDCGGMYELKKIAAMAEAAGMKCSPHGPAGPVCNMAGAHVCATMPNFQILEYGYGEVDWRLESVEPAEELHNGRLRVSSRPGIGYEMNPKLWKKVDR